MKIKAAIPAMGSKRALAATIIEELGAHSAYWEPFFGGLSIVLAKPESSHETIGDLHGDATNLAWVLQDPTLAPRLYERLVRTLCSDGLHEHAKGMCNDQCEHEVGDVERAYWFFVMSWMGQNGRSLTKGCEKTSFAVRWTPTGGHGGKRFASAVDSIPAWHRRLRRITILRKCGFDMLDRIDDHPKVATYCDPPYLEKGAEYVHDFTEADHADLATRLDRFKDTRVVVSYYDHPWVDVLYRGWTKRCVARNKNLSVSRGRGSPAQRAPEILLLNGPSYAKGA